MAESPSFLSDTSFLAPGKDESSIAPLLVSHGDTSIVLDDVNPFLSPIATQVSSTVAVLSPCTPGGRELVLHLEVSPSPPLLPPKERDIEAELRSIVDGLIRKKRDTFHALTEDNAALRAQIGFLQETLLKASTQPGSETADLFAALERERTLRMNAEESRSATGKYLAEQVERISQQKTLLEKTMASFTHGREYWKGKAIAALEQCELLEEENVRVKTQLNNFGRKQDTVIQRQIGDILREVAQERDRLKKLEETNTLDKLSTPEKERPEPIREVPEVEQVQKSKLFGSKRFVAARLNPDVRRVMLQAKK